LVVDDRAIVREFMEEVLGRAGHEVRSAASGERALEILQAETFGVMFLDLGLPGVEGLSLCREIRKDHPVALLHAMTGCPPAFEPADCRAAGFDDYFIKPVLAEEILKAAEDAFEKIDRWNRGCDVG
jgi:CheY-like chemotaxis protein